MSMYCIYKLNLEVRQDSKEMLHRRKSPISRIAINNMSTILWYSRKYLTSKYLNTGYYLGLMY